MAKLLRKNSASTSESAKSLIGRSSIRKGSTSMKKTSKTSSISKENPLLSQPPKAFGTTMISSIDKRSKIAKSHNEAKKNSLKSLQARFDAENELLRNDEQQQTRTYSRFSR